MEYILVFITGLGLGSFVNALVWRLHESNRKKSRFSKEQLSIVAGRSMCTKCGYQLRALDLVPVFSWLVLKGRCRHCKKPISWQYPVVEVLFTVGLLVSYMFWPLNSVGWLLYLQFSVWASLLVVMAALFIYDLRWMILPTILVRLATVFSVLLTAVYVLQGNNISIISSILIGSVLLGGLFWIIYQISDGKWIGGGDVRLGFAIGLLLGWQKTILCIALAAYIGTIIILVTFLLRKFTLKMKLPFGPLLIAGWYVSFIWGQQIIDWYLSIVVL